MAQEKESPSCQACQVRVLRGEAGGDTVAMTAEELFLQEIDKLSRPVVTYFDEEKEANYARRMIGTIRRGERPLGASTFYRLAVLVEDKKARGRIARILLRKDKINSSEDVYEGWLLGLAKLARPNNFNKRATRLALLVRAEAVEAERKKERE